MKTAFYVKYDQTTATDDRESVKYR